MPHILGYGEKDFAAMTLCTKIQLGFLYTELTAEWTSYLLRKPIKFWLPTEAIVFSPRIVTPAVACAYRTHLYIVEGCVVTYPEIAHRPGFVGTYQEVEVILAEVWTDSGSDGHVQWMQRGWRFVPDSTLHLRHKSYCGGLLPPEPMQMQAWDYL